MTIKRNTIFPDQVVPLLLTAVVFGVVALLYHIEVTGLNHLVVARETISPILRWSDVLVGMTIYLKTSIDFAIFIGRLMGKFGGWKNRIMIEIGTALGNALGTMAILVIWDIFREVRFLMAIMIVIAAFVLLRLAEEGLDHVKDEQGRYKFSFGGFAEKFEKTLHLVNSSVAPVLSKVVPSLKVQDPKKVTYLSLFMFAFTVPFLLGLDDFAGYIPLFNIVNVFGFGVGVFAGHMVLNIFLFLSPKRTIALVKHPVISFIGSLAFVGLAIWGMVEAAKLIGL